MSGEWRIPARSEVAPRAQALAEMRFIPQRYEPNYAYPLMVLFHGRGHDEGQLIRSVPRMSWRNYVALGLRGPEVVRRRGAEVGYSWGPAFHRHAERPELSGSAAKVLECVMEGPGDDLDQLEDNVFEAIRDLRRGLHVHSERIFLVGVGEGAAVAYRLGLTHPERFAGVVAMNGWVPRSFTPLARLDAVRRSGLKILALHGEWNGRAPVQRTRREVGMLRSAGIPVAFQTYPCASRLSSPMLADVDSWLIQQCTLGC